MPRRWPKQQRLIHHLREVLRRDFDCQDAWVATTGAYCRLEVRIRGRQITLLEDAEDLFWALFYTPVERERMHLGERFVEVQLWRKSPKELSALLIPYWTRRVGPLSRFRPPRLRSVQAP